MSNAQWIYNTEGIHIVSIIYSFGAKLEAAKDSNPILAIIIIK